VHLVGFIIRIYHDARSSERHTHLTLRRPHQNVHALVFTTSRDFRNRNFQVPRLRQLVLQCCQDQLQLEQWVEDTASGTLEQSERNVPQCHFIHRESHTDWPHIETGPLRLYLVDKTPDTWHGLLKPEIHRIKIQSVPQSEHYVFLISNFRSVFNIVRFLLGNSSASECRRFGTLCLVHLHRQKKA